MQCGYYVRQLVAHYPEIQASNTQVLVVGPGEAATAQWLARQQKAPFPVLYDSDGKVYDEYALHRIFLSMIQQSAAFIIDRQGIIRYAHKTNNALDWLRPNAFDSLLAALKTLEN